MSGNFVGNDDYARAQREREKTLPLTSGMDLTVAQCQALERHFKDAWEAHGDGGDRPAATRIWYTAVLALMTQFGCAPEAPIKLPTTKKDLTKIGGC